jgi:lysophospholipase L1-like esterase
LPQGNNAYVGFDSALNVANNFSGLMVDTSGGLSLIVNGSQVGSTIAYTGSFSTTTANLLTFSVNTSTGAISGISFQGSTSAYSFTTSAFTSAATSYAAFFVPTGSSGHGIFANLTVTSGSGGGSAPAAPTGLAATAGNAQVVLNWTASSGATGYNVYRGTTPGGESTTAIATGVTSTSFTNTGLTNGTAYYYKVTATNSSGTSSYSNEASATPTAGPTPPPAPAGMAASPGNAQVGLSWTASSGATSYNVYRGTSSGGESTTAIATGITTTSYTNTGLSNGTAYYFKVTATNSAGTSGYSNEASAIPSGSGTYLPATATAPTGVYSLTKLVSTYSGPAITVVRSDSTSMDIGFVGQNLDTATANSFAAGSLLTISKVYDQSGNGNNLTQTTASLQPKLIMTAVSTPAPPVVLVRQSEYFNIPSTLTANRQNYSSFMAARFPTNLRPTPVFDMGNGTTFDFGWFTTYDNYLQQGLTDSGTETNGTARTLPSASPCIVGVVSSSSGITYHRDAFTVTAAAVTSEVMSNGGKLMACHTPYVDGRCDMFSWVFYPAALSGTDSTAVKAALQTLHSTNANTLTSHIWIQGDSITEGVGATYNITIARVLSDAIGDPSKMVRCFGKSGDEMVYDYATWSGLGSNYLEPGASNILVVWLGTNDIALGRTAAQLWSDYANYISYAHAAGWTKIVGVTALPRGDLTPAEETERQSFNAMVRANSAGYFNAIWDADALTASGQPLNGYVTNTALSPDHLHPSEAAYQLMAPSLKSAVSTLY